MKIFSNENEEIIIKSWKLGPKKGQQLCKKLTILIFNLTFYENNLIYIKSSIKTFTEQLKN